MTDLNDLSFEDTLAHYGVKGMQKGVRKDPRLTVSDQSARPVVKDSIRAAPKPSGAGYTVRSVGVAPAKKLDVAVVKHTPKLNNPDPVTKQRMGLGASFMKSIFVGGGSINTKPTVTRRTTKSGTSTTGTNARRNYQPG